MKNALLAHIHFSSLFHRLGFFLSFIDHRYCFQQVVIIADDYVDGREYSAGTHKKITLSF